MGFVLARNPDGTIYGYCWPLKEYGWLNVWHQPENGVPVAKGIEFGTTGKGIEYYELLTKGGGRFRNQLSWDYLKAKEIKKKTYTGFYFTATGLIDVVKIAPNAGALTFTDSKDMSVSIK